MLAAVSAERAISVVISNLNGARYLPRLLDTLVAQVGVGLEIVVVDRHSTDASLEILASYPAVRVVHEAPESGLVAGYAVGARHASHELLFFCNEDLYLAEDCLQLLASQIDLKRRIAAADPWQWTYDGEKWIHGGTRFRRSPWHIYSPFPLRMHEFTVPLPEGAVVAFGGAAAVMIDASVYRELGGWDTSFFLDYEDLDLFLRAWQHDWTCVTVPSARVYHAVGASNDQIVGSRQQRVSRRRYVSHRSSVIVIAFKYFSPSLTAFGALNWMATVLTNALLLRWRTIWLDLTVVGDVLRRLPAVFAFRRSNRDWNRAKPGEKFFLEPQFSTESAGVVPLVAQDA
jgi:N-acetylglucosaminyl-diphospho-decaprenol L-rhamnosyltransferase